MSLTFDGYRDLGASCVRVIAGRGGPEFIAFVGTLLVAFLFVPLATGWLAVLGCDGSVPFELRLGSE